MVTKLFFVWFLAVASFFALWALWVVIVRRISKKKDKKTD